MSARRHKSLVTVHVPQVCDGWARNGESGAAVSIRSTLHHRHDTVTTAYVRDQ